MTDTTNLTSSPALGGRLSPETQSRLADRLASLRAKQPVGGVRPRATAGPAPLSPAQEALWLFEQMHPGTSTYVVASARRMRGPFDVRALGRALAAVVAKHAALRTTIEETPDGPVQIVGEPPVDDFPIEVRDVDADGAAVATQLTADARRPVDLRTGPTLRMTGYVHGDFDPVLLLVTHHLLVDGASLAIIWRDITAAYELALRGPEPRLAPPPVQMADVAVWERDRLAAGALDAGSAYWRAQLDGAPASVEFPLDWPRADRAVVADTFRTQLASVSWDRVLAAARQHRGTPFTVLAAVYALLLFRWTGQDEVVVGVPVARRSRPELHDVVGYLANMLPLRVRVGSGDTIADVIARVQALTIAMFEHEDVPIVTLARSGGARGGEALFATMFSMLDAANDDAPRDGVRFDAVPLALDSAKCDLSMSVSRQQDALRLAIEYRADIFARGTIERAAMWFETLLDAALRDTAATVDRLPMTVAEERRLLLEEWGTAPGRAGTGTVSANVRRSMARLADAVAIVADTASLTYRELEGHIASAAAALAMCGVARGSVVGLVADRSAATIVSSLAILELGAAYVPIDPTYPIERIRRTLASAGARVVITAADHASSLAADFAVVPIDDVLGMRAQSPDAVLAPSPACEPEDVAVILFTSGSTGTPKGVMIPHRALVNHSQWMHDDVGVNTDDVVLHRAPLTFDVSVWETLGALVHGARIVVAGAGRHADAEYMANAIAANGVTVVQLTPTIAWALLDEPAFAACRSLRMVLLGGEASTPDLVARLRAALPSVILVNGYGPTEATIDAVWTFVGDRSETTVPIGRPIRNATAYVLSRTGELQPIGVPGELWIGGAGLAIGYLGDPELTAARFVMDPFAKPDSARMYRTGDRARWRPDGQLEFLGRADDQVKLRGVRLELGEVESALRAHPEVSAAAAAIRAHGGEQQLVAYYTSRSGEEIDVGALRDAVAALLPPVAVPSVYVQLDALPRTVSGKVDRRALPAPPERAAPYVAPEGEVEAIVADVWQSVLCIEGVSADAHFFAIGGHSLLATRITARLNRLFGITIPLRRFFDAETVRGVARLVTDVEVEPGRARAVARALLRLRDMSPEQKARLRNDAPAAPSRPASR